MEEVAGVFIKERRVYLRILHFGRFWSDNMGGIERHVEALLGGLAARGLTCVNLVPAEGREAAVLRHHGYDIVCAPSYGVRFRTALSPALVRQARRLHRERPFDVFHAHFPDPLTHLALALLPRGVPRVITWHSDMVPYPALQTLYQPLVNATLVRAAAIVGATPAHLRTRQIPDSVPASRRHVIPYGMDFTPFEPTEVLRARVAAVRAVANGRTLIFAVGRHVGYKGFDVLIRAMKRLPQAHLLLGGTGPLHAAHETLARELGVADRVTFAGRIPEEDLPVCYHACDVFCMPSVGATEAFGLVQIEAMACGRPVVCTQMGNGVNEVNLDGQTGLSVAVGDEVALSAALGRLMDDPALRRRLGAAGRRRAHAMFGLNGMVTATLALYRSLGAGGTMGLPG